MENVRRHIPFFSRGRWGVKNPAPWTTILQHTFHQFHENDLFTPAAAMSYFGLLTLFPALLVMLVQHVGKVLSKTQLLTQVWGFDAYDANLVEVHMSALRRKLEAAGPRLIQTVRGVGYVLRREP